MKIVFLSRDCLEAQFIAGKLASAGFHPILVLESGKPARRRKLARHFLSSPAWRWPARLLDLLFLFLLGRITRRLLPKNISGYPALMSRIHCEDANDEIVVGTLTSQKPDLVLVYGTAILKPEVLALAPVFLNIHGGIVPKYRNVHSEFWALYDGMDSEIGTTILHMNRGIDSGAVALQRRLNGTKTLTAARAENLKLAADLAVEALRNAESAKLDRVPQVDGESALRPTPRWHHILAAFYRRKI